MSIKALFSNIANVLLDWDDVHNDDFCSWNLSNLNLGGEISPAIGDLKNLQSMDFQGNKLTGQIPDEIGNCVSLMLVGFFHGYSLITTLVILNHALSGIAVLMVMKYADNIMKVKTFKPQLVVVRNEWLVDELKAALADVEDKPEIIPGEQGVIEVAHHPDAVTV